jgi:hypothetical protein
VCILDRYPELAQLKSDYCTVYHSVWFVTDTAKRNKLSDPRRLEQVHVCKQRSVKFRPSSPRATVLSRPCCQSMMSRHRPVHNQGVKDVSDRIAFPCFFSPSSIPLCAYLEAITIQTSKRRSAFRVRSPRVTRLSPDRVISNDRVLKATPEKLRTLLSARRLVKVVCSPTVDERRKTPVA